VKFYCYKFTVFNSQLCHIATVWVLIRRFGGLYYLHIHGDAYLDKCHKNGDSILLLNIDANLSYLLQNPRTELWFYVHSASRAQSKLYDRIVWNTSMLVTVVCSRDN
jgi:hypothetical protein